MFAGADPEQIGGTGAIVLFVMTGKSFRRTALLADMQTSLLPEETTRL